MLRLPPEEALGLGPGTLLGVGDGWTSVCHIFCIHSSIHLLTSALSLTSLGICAFTSSFVHLFHNLPTHLFIYLLVHSSTCSVTYSFLGSVAYLATQLGSDLNVGCSPSGLGIARLNKLQDTELWQTPSVPQGRPASILLPSPSGYRGLSRVSTLYPTGLWPACMSF